MIRKRIFLQILLLIVSSLLFGIILFQNIKNSYNIQQIELDQNSQAVFSEEFFKTKFNTRGLSALSREVEVSRISSPEFVHGPLLIRLREIFEPYRSCIQVARERLEKRGIRARFGITTNYFYLYPQNESLAVIGREATVRELRIFGDMKVFKSEDLKTRFHHKGVDMSYYFRINFYAKITNRNAYILNQLRGLIASSIIGFIILLGFLVYISHSIITQKKISDMKDDFINNITHELNTPLTTIDVALKSIGRIDSDAKRIALLETVKRQNLRLRNMVKKIMQISFYDREGIFLSRSPRSVNQLLENICSDFQVRSEDRIDIQLQLEASRDQMNIDPFHFESAVNNLLVNAVKYCDGAPDIDIRTTNHDDRLMLAICDRGSGIPSKYHRKVFNKFFRFRSRGDEVRAGLGLGLYLVERIIKAHGGSIVLKNNTGGGSCFLITLPIQ